ncbi:MAG TPA: SH3 domain-containing protein [Alphaproteobacteria bacterium]
MLARTILLLSFLAAVGPGAAHAQPRSHTGESLPLPRYVSLRSDEVNVRTGPGVRYPVEWVFTRRHMPVEVIQEFEHWRKIRDVEGTEGWVHQSMLSGRRYALVTGEVRTLRRRPEADAPVVARVEPGVVGEIVECEGQWCRIDAGGIRGWLPRNEFWGVYPNETLR